MLCLSVFLLKSKRFLGRFALPLAGVVPTLIKDKNNLPFREIQHNINKIKVQLRNDYLQNYKKEPLRI